jgi:hypothetical protein
MWNVDEIKPKCQCHQHKNNNNLNVAMSLVLKSFKHCKLFAFLKLKVKTFYRFWHARVYQGFGLAKLVFDGFI